MKSFLALQTLTLSAVMALQTGCSKVSADDIKQSAWRAQYNVENKNGRIRCVASFRAGGASGSFIELNGSSDTVYCQNQPMHRINGAINDVYYETYVDKPASDKIFIELRRPNGSYYAYVNVPQPIEPTGVYANSLYKGQAFWRSWIARQDTRMRVTMQYRVAGDIKYIDRFQPTDQGQVRFEEQDTPHYSTYGSVPASITYTRINVGSMPEGLQGSIESSSQFVESVTFQ